MTAWIITRLMAFGYGAIAVSLGPAVGFMVFALCWIAAMSGAGVLVSRIKTPPPRDPAYLLALRAAFAVIGVIPVLVDFRNLAATLRFTPTEAD